MTTKNQGDSDCDGTGGVTVDATGSETGQITASTIVFSGGEPAITGNVGASGAAITFQEQCSTGASIEFGGSSAAGGFSMSIIQSELNLLTGNTVRLLEITNFAY